MFVDVSFFDLCRKAKCMLKFLACSSHLGMTIWCLLVTNTLLVTRQLRVIQPWLPNQKLIICKIFHNTPTPWLLYIFLFFSTKSYSTVSGKFDFNSIVKTKTLLFWNWECVVNLATMTNFSLDLLTWEVQFTSSQTVLSSWRICFCGLLELLHHLL